MAPRTGLDLAALCAEVSDWAQSLDLSWVRVEHGPALAGLLSDLPVPLAILASGPLRCVGADRFGRRALLAEASLSPNQTWTLELAPRPDALLDHLLESGCWPLWLAEVQVRVLPLQSAQIPAAEALVARLSEAGYRADCESAGPLGARIQSAARERVPATCVLGPREIRDERVTLRWRGTDSHELLTEEALLRVLGVNTHPAEVTSAKPSSATDKARFAASNRRH